VGDGGQNAIVRVDPAAAQESRYYEVVGEPGGAVRTNDDAVESGLLAERNTVDLAARRI
jgi:hypothetical protein